MRDAAGEVGLNSYSWGPPHMDEQRKDHQVESTYNSFVLIQDVALKIYRKRWTIEKSGGREGKGDPCWWRDMVMMMMTTNKNMLILPHTHTGV